MYNPPHEKMSDSTRSMDASDIGFRRDYWFDYQLQFGPRCIRTPNSATIEKGQRKR